MAEKQQGALDVWNALPGSETSKDVSIVDQGKALHFLCRTHCPQPSNSGLRIKDAVD